jgi:hypothetical protein
LEIVMDDTAGLTPFGLILALATGASFLAWHLAGRKVLDQRRWALTCFLFFPALIALAVARSRLQAGDTAAFQDRWAALAAYDPDVKAAVERMAALGPAAVERFRQAYADVQAKEAIPLIVADLEARWAADHFDGTHARSERLDELRRQGRISEREHAEQRRRLRERRLQRTWTGLWWKLPLALLALWLIWPRGAPAGFPTCEAGTTRELVRRAIENADDRGQVHRRLLALDQIRELVGDAEKRDRTCVGEAVLNSGERRIVWQLYARGDSIFVNVSGF